MERTDRPYGSKDQFNFDMAMWYGTLAFQDSKKAEILYRILTVVYWGGLFFQHSKMWKPWAETGIPICSALSHRGRIMVQLPPLEENETGWEFFNWLAGGGVSGKQLVKRKAALNSWVVDTLNVSASAAPESKIIDRAKK
ncbi:MAG: hypothetical protein MUO88_17920 [Desulfobacterales bacterium]|nr:hypothetical protein [Desulfobacterales bacterium]